MTRYQSGSSTKLPRVPPSRMTMSSSRYVLCCCACTHADVPLQSRQASYAPTDPASAQWAMREKRKQGQTGRATGRATIVGSKVKNGGGSLRPGQSASNVRQQVEPRKRSLKAAPSILQGAGLSRSSRFES